jgi:Coenzyme PQQ synthesis protein D (PqqD)
MESTIASDGQLYDGATRLVWNPRVAARTLDGTAFVLLEARMVSLNEVGTRIWGRFKDGANLEEVVQTVLAEFDTDEEQARADARAFIAALVGRNMLIPVSGEPGRAS